MECREAIAFGVSSGDEISFEGEMECDRRLVQMYLSAYSDVMTMQDLRAALRIGRSLAYDLVNKGEIYSFKIGKVMKIPKLCVIDFILKNRYNEINQQVAGVEERS